MSIYIIFFVLRNIFGLNLWKKKIFFLNIDLLLNYQHMQSMLKYRFKDCHGLGVKMIIPLN
jgi:hypothetical protein